MTQGRSVGLCNRPAEDGLGVDLPVVPLDGTGFEAGQIEQAAGELSQQSELLKSEVGKFLISVRAA